jgi:hypothetical protein
MKADALEIDIFYDDNRQLRGIPLIHFTLRRVAPTWFVEGSEFLKV